MATVIINEGSNMSKFVIIEQLEDMSRLAFFFSDTQKAQEKALQLIKNGVMLCVVPDIFDVGVHSFSVIHIDSELDVDTLVYIA